MIIIIIIIIIRETLPLMSREEHRLRVDENRVLRRIFKPKRVKVTENRKKKIRDAHFIISILQ
jgi:hypothetical protein